MIESLIPPVRRSVDVRAGLNGVRVYLPKNLTHGKHPEFSKEVAASQNV
jgi:hypothetical protein